MGKKSKLFKGGMNRKNYQVVLNAKKMVAKGGGKVILNEEDNLSSGWESVSDNNNENNQMDIDNPYKNNKSTNNHQTNSTNNYVIKREPGQLRHRRNVRKTAPTRGQRKRQEKKDKMLRRNLLTEKLRNQMKLQNTTMLNNKSDNDLSTANLNTNIKNNTNSFNLKELDNNLFSILDDLKHESVKAPKKKRNRIIR